MTPLGWTCEHDCCPDDDTPHAHLMDPDACGDCKALRPSERAVQLESRALRIGARKHQNLIDEKENNDGDDA